MIKLPSVFFLMLFIGLLGAAERPRAQSVLSPSFAETNAGLTPEERSGREIWMFATAFNDRFFTYTYPQRLGAAIDWYEVLAAEKRGDLFDAWGAILIRIAAFRAIRSVRRGRRTRLSG